MRDVLFTQSYLEGKPQIKITILNLNGLKSYKLGSMKTSIAVRTSSQL